MHQIPTLIIKGDEKVCWSKIILRKMKHVIDWISTLKKVFKVISDPRMNVKYVAKDKNEYLMPWFSAKSLLNLSWPHYAKILEKHYGMFKTHIHELTAISKLLTLSKGEWSVR